MVDTTRYHQLIESLMDLVNTRPYLCYVVNTLSQYMVDPKSVQSVEAKHVLRYIKGTLDY